VRLEDEDVPRFEEGLRGRIEAARGRSTWALDLEKM